MKKLINSADAFVPEMLEGIALANAALVHDPSVNLIRRSDSPNPDRVSIVQGSGSGHEPAHVLLVGEGLLDAACPGDVFAAPSVDNIVVTARQVASPAGVLFIVNNYTGDRMAFDMAKELCDAEGISAEIVVVDDDVAVQDSTFTVGRRGVAGNFFVIKAVGAAAADGAALSELVELATEVNAATRSIGCALTSCTPPAKGSPLFNLGESEVEMGVGIHGEPGRERQQLRPVDALVEDMLDAIMSDKRVSTGHRVALMINGLGGTPISELYIAYRRAHQVLTAQGAVIGRSYVGEYCTSLDMAGFSLTVSWLTPRIESLLAAPASAALRIF